MYIWRTIIILFRCRWISIAFLTAPKFLPNKNNWLPTYKLRTSSIMRTTNRYWASHICLVHAASVRGNTHPSKFRQVMESIISDLRFTAAYLAASSRFLGSEDEQEARIYHLRLSPPWGTMSNLLQCIKFFGFIFDSNSIHLCAPCYYWLSKTRRNCTSLLMADF